MKILKTSKRSGLEITTSCLLQFSKIVEDMKSEFGKTYLQVLKLIVQLLNFQWTKIHFNPALFSILVRKMRHNIREGDNNC